MDLEVTLKKNGAVVGREVISNPQDGDVAAAAGRLFDQARRANPDETMWDAQINVKSV